MLQLGVNKTHALRRRSGYWLLERAVGVSVCEGRGEASAVGCGGVACVCVCVV